MTAAKAIPSGAPSLEKYEIVEEIGSGGMATVYRARDVRLGRDVAVKVIHKHLRENTEVARRFVAEARAAAKLKHPGIVEVYDVSAEEEPERFLVVELLRGTTLRRIFEAHRDMPAEVGACIVACLCDALEHAHEMGIIHRDVKPENVLVELATDRARPRDAVLGLARDRERDRTPVPRDAQTARELPSLSRDAPEPSSESPAAESGAQPRQPSAAQPDGDATLEPEPANANANAGGKKRRDERAAVVIKLTDFGIAKTLDAQGVTSTGQVLGSPAHMAPEQIEGADVDGRTDVFALGVLFYECVVGHLPFEGKSPAQVLRRVLDGRFAPVERERPTAGARWGEMIAGALAQDLAVRTPSPGALREKILAELEALGLGEPRDEITAYFDDPKAYAAELLAKIVPRLLERGEAARKARDACGASWDFNRALALSPNDPAIMKRVTSLSRGESRRGLARRVGALAAASVVLGASAFGAARLWKKRAAVEAPPSVGSAIAFAEPSVRARDASTAAPTSAPTSESSAEPPPKRVYVAAMPTGFPTPTGSAPTGGSPNASPSGSAAAGASSMPRKVRFNILPKGARLLVDGAEVRWFGQMIELPVGPHSIDIRVPNSKCCKPLSESLSVTAPPEADPSQIVLVSRQLVLVPATVTLSNAPTDAQMRCPDIGLSLFAGAAASAKLRETEWKGKCEFKAPTGESTTRSLVFRAGEPHTVAWPL